MLKRVGLIAAGFVGLIALGAVFTALTGGGDNSSEQPHAQAAPDEPAKLDLWPGNAKHIYSATLNKRGQLLALERVEFKQLNLRYASAVVHLRTNRPKSAAPAWLKAQNFSGYRPQSDRTFRPDSFKVRRDGSEMDVSLSWKRIPSGALGPTCSDPAGPDDPLFLRVADLPGRDFAFAINASAPAGECLADPEAIALHDRKLMLQQRGARIVRLRQKGRHFMLRGSINAGGLESAMLEAGRPGHLSKIRELPVKQKLFQAKFKIRGNGPRLIRITLTDPNLGQLHPAAGQRRVKVGRR